MTTLDELKQDEAQPLTDVPTVDLVARAEIDQQVATAKKYPRSITAFMREAMSMATLNENIAGECIYALPRGDKVIRGPSARLGEIILSAWGNCRAGARVVAEDDQFITAQGVFHDIQRNTSVTYEIRRRITDRQGNKYSADMIAVTGNAASSIAMRNAILKGVPKAFWAEIYDKAAKLVAGDTHSVAERREQMLVYAKKMGITEEMIFGLFDAKGIEDIGQDELVQIRGIITALKEGDISVEEAFPVKEETEEKPAVPKEHREKESKEESKPRRARFPIDDGHGGWTDKTGAKFDERLHEWDDDANQPRIATRGRATGCFVKRKGTRQGATIDVPRTRVDEQAQKDDWNLE